jgi:hypothetical protein
MKQLMIIICMLIVASSCGKNKKFTPPIKEDNKEQVSDQEKEKFEETVSLLTPDIIYPDIDINIEAANLINKNNFSLDLNVNNRNHVFMEDITMRGIAKSVFNIHHVEDQHFPLKSLAKFQFKSNDNLSYFSHSNIKMIEVKFSVHNLININNIRSLKLQITDINGREICHATLNPRAVLDTSEINVRNYKHFKNIKLPCFILNENTAYESLLKKMNPFYLNLVDVEYITKEKIESLKMLYGDRKQKEALLYISLPDNNIQKYINSSKNILENITDIFDIKMNSDDTLESLDSFISYPLASFYNQDFFKQGHWFNINPYSTSLTHPIVGGSIYQLMYKKQDDFKLEHLSFLNQQDYQLSRTFKSTKDAHISIIKDTNEISQVIVDLEQEFFIFKTEKLVGKFRASHTPREGYRYQSCKFYYKKIAENNHLKNDSTTLKNLEFFDQNKWISIANTNFFKITNKDNKTVITIPRGLTQIQIRLKPLIRSDYEDYKFIRYSSSGSASCRGEKYKSFSVPGHSRIEKDIIPKEKSLKANIMVKHFGFKF